MMSLCMVEVPICNDAFNNAIKSCEELWNKPETILEFYVLFRFIMDYTSVGYKIASLKRVM